MAVSSDRMNLGSSAARLGEISRGEILGQLPRQTAERGYRLYQERCVNRVSWTGQDVEAALSNPACTVQIGEGSGRSFECGCSLCGHRVQLCFHAAAALMQWLDIRATMLRMGPGTIWRANSRHPFLAPSRSAADRVDLSHLTGVDLRSALELQLSLQKTGTAVARLKGREVEIRITLPSKDERTVVFNAAVLPSALPVLNSLPRLKLTGELKDLEISEARLHPVLTAAWMTEGIVLEPGFGLTNGAVLPMKELQDRIHGRWALIGSHLCRLLDPATPLVPFFRKGRHVLRGQEALRFLSLDHPQLRQHSWYKPLGELATFRQPLVPTPKALLARSENDEIHLRPIFEVQDRELAWGEVIGLLRSGFSRTGELLVRAPELHLFEECGFQLPKRQVERGLVGDRIAFMRLLAETGLPLIGEDEDLMQLANVLRGAGIEAVPKPPGLRSQLRPYQQDGVAWMWSHYQAGVGALLADDMGLGKTHQVMGLLCLVRQRCSDARFLVVCPRGVLEHWDHLLSLYAPELDTHVFHGPDRSLSALPEAGGVVLTTYDIIIRSTAEVTATRWEVVVFDEAQRIKNPRTKAARAVRKIKTPFSVALTGTPLENRLTELWSVVDLIVSGYLGSEREFRSIYRNPSQQQLERLRQRMSVLTLRRLKEQVLSDLPDKVEDLRYCRLTSQQEALYGRIHGQQAPAITEKLLDPDSDIPYLHIFALLTKLKQLCDHPTLIDKSLPLTAAVSGKLEVFDEILDEALSGNHQVVVFTQYVTMIELLSRHLGRRRLPFLTLTGDTKDRGRVVRRFNSGQHETILLASLLAGGVGIDLTGASVVIHYDRWWNPAKENQATDRVHRIGQKRFVQVFKLVTRNTIEERIDAMIQQKTKLLDEVVTPTEDVLRGLSRSEIAELLDLKIERE